MPAFDENVMQFQINHLLSTQEILGTYMCACLFYIIYSTKHMAFHSCAGDNEAIALMSKTPKSSKWRSWLHSMLTIKEVDEDNMMGC
jgi:hypothetical protein